MDSRSSANKAQSFTRLRNLLPLNNSTHKVTGPICDALTLLNIRDLDGLENHFLALEAFIRPWAHFRDTYFLLQSVDAARASEPGVIKRVDLLRFYTNYLHGELRYDPRADDNSSSFSADATKYGTYDTSHWQVEDYEKLMYAWMLQEFKVGKKTNPFGFRYFECGNICSIWEDIFEPIVVAVRESYDIRGRRYYGRLAAFIENRFPSRLAFPATNVPTPMIQSPTPFRLISFSKGQRDTSPPLPRSLIEAMPKTPRFSAKEYAAVEAELRDVSDKYGGVVERPKFKLQLKEWLSVQKERAKMKKQFSGRESPVFGCKGVNVVSDPALPTGVRRSMSTMSSSSSGRSPEAQSVGPFNRPKSAKSKIPTKKEGTVPYGQSTYTRKASSEHQSPQNQGYAISQISQDIELLRTLPSVKAIKETKEMNMKEKRMADLEEEPLPMPAPAFSKPNMERKGSDGVYTSIRNSNPFEQAVPLRLDSMLEKGDDQSSEEFVLSPMGPPSAIPKPLFNTAIAEKKREGGKLESPTARFAQKNTEPRVPSYTGNGYENEITSGFISHKLHATSEYDPTEAQNMYAQPSRIPAPIHTMAQRRAASNKSRTYEVPEQVGQQSGDQSPQHIPWPGQDSPDTSMHSTSLEDYDSAHSDEGPPPPVPPKNPRRSESTRRPGESPLAPPKPQYAVLGPRIISKENIRAHVDISRESSLDNLEPVDETEEMNNQASSSPVRPLHTYNTHMFPRRDRNGTPMGGWM
jgi:hypothetical protein